MITVHCKRQFYIVDMLIQNGSGEITLDRGWSTKWRAVSKWMFVCSAWPTARCHRSVTRTTTVLLTRRVSSTHTTLHSSPTRPTLSLTTPGPGGVRSSAMSSKRHRIGLKLWHFISLRSTKWRTIILTQCVTLQKATVTTCRNMYNLYSKQEAQLRTA